MSKGEVSEPMENAPEWHSEHKKWRAYETISPDSKVFVFDTAKESGHSLLKANNLNPDNCLILKKIL